jgi:hypothetical protein
LERTVAVIDSDKAMRSAQSSSSAAKHAELFRCHLAEYQLFARTTAFAGFA